MTFGTKKPIREDLLERLHPILVKYKDNLTILDWDVQLQTFTRTVGNGQPQLINAWGLVVITTGGLLGKENYISYVWTFGETPQVPDDRELIASVQETFRRIRIMQARQLQQSPN